MTGFTIRDGDAGQSSMRIRPGIWSFCAAQQHRLLQQQVMIDHRRWEAATKVVGTEIDARAGSDGDSVLLGSFRFGEPSSVPSCGSNAITNRSNKKCAKLGEASNRTSTASAGLTVRIVFDVHYRKEHPERAHALFQAGCRSRPFLASMRRFCPKRRRDLPSQACSHGGQVHARRRNGRHRAHRCTEAHGPLGAAGHRRESSGAPAARSARSSSRRQRQTATQSCSQASA